MSSEKRREQRKRERKMNFMATKASFVAGIVLIFTIIKDIVKLFTNELPTWMILCFSGIGLVAFALVLGTKVFDERMESKKVSNFGNFLTIMSVIFWVIENTVFELQGAYTLIEKIALVGGIGIVSMLGALYLLFAKYNR